MNRAIVALVGAVRKTFADSLLPKLLLGVVIAALFFWLVLDTAGVAIGVLVIGGVTAYLESSGHRNRKR